MKLLSTLAFILLIPLALFAQTPPTGTHTPVGLSNQWQTGTGTPGAQYVEARCAPADAGSAALGGQGVRIGHRLWWATASSQPGVLPQTWAASNTTAVVFGVVSFHFTFGTLPGAAAGFDSLFIDPTVAVIASPWTVTHPAGYLNLIVPPGGFDLEWLYWDVPNQSNLIGLVVDMQAMRVDGNSLFYLSDEWLVQIVQ